MPPSRTRRRARIGANRELAGTQFLHTALIHHQHHYVGRRDADLKSNAAAFDADGGGRTPSGPASRAAETDPSPVLSADPEGSLFEIGYENDTVRLFQEVLRNRAVWRSHDFAEEAGGI